jgi:uncharacterized protein YbaP (TraB family)
MKRRDLLLALLLSPVFPARGARFEQGLLWEIARKGSPPSHVYGTIHVGDPRLETLPARVRSAFDSAQSLMLEFVSDDYVSERFLEAAMFADRQTLQEKIGAEDFERVVAQLAPIGLSREFIDKLKPWGVLLNLRDPRRAGGVTPDARLAEQARARRMPVFRIEGVEEQIFTFDELPMDTQVALLKHGLAHRDELLELGDRTLDAYLAGDLGAIWRLREQFIARYPEVATHQAAFTQRILYDRSVVMAFRVQRELRRGRAFVALGALHLYGEKGVPALLEQDGWHTRRMH